MLTTLALATAAVAGPVRFGTVQLATGVKLAYAEQGDPRGPAIILLHGYSDSWFSFSLLLPLLPEKYHVFALDQRGHGGSDKPGSGYQLRDLGRDVVAFLDAKGIRRATIVGHSMGSFAAQQVALFAPERVEKLVLVGSGTTLRNMEGRAEFAAAVNALSDQVSLDFIREFQESTVFRPLPNGFMDRAVAESTKLPARVWKSLLEGFFAVPADPGLARLAMPTLLIWGDRDAVFHRAEAERLAAAIPGARFVVREGTGHAVHWEEPEAVAREIVGFLEAR